MKYTKDCLTYDEFGLKSVNCVRCGEVVKERAITEKEHNGNKVNVFYMKNYSHLERVPFELSDGSITHMLMCTECAGSYNDTEKDEIIKQFKNGHIQALKQQKGNEHFINEIKNKPLTVIGRMKEK